MTDSPYRPLRDLSAAPALVRAQKSEYDDSLAKLRELHGVLLDRLIAIAQSSATSDDTILQMMVLMMDGAFKGPPHGR